MKDSSKHYTEETASQQTTTTMTLFYVRLLLTTQERDQGEFQDMHVIKMKTYHLKK